MACGSLAVSSAGGIQRGQGVKGKRHYGVLYSSGNAERLKLRSGSFRAEQFGFKAEFLAPRYKTRVRHVIRTLTLKYVTSSSVQNVPPS